MDDLDGGAGQLGGPVDGPGVAGGQRVEDAAHGPGRVEVAACRGLVKGYGETHERGRARFNTLIAMLPQMAAFPNAAEVMRELRKAAVADDSGLALDDAIARLSPLPKAAE